VYVIWRLRVEAITVADRDSTGVYKTLERKSMGERRWIKL